ncbi:UNKNOWN [Stylonychia lemnae]|uniref:Uncharacterized protein n=1 Tax=Stylonychia lemnae TaxID=5949 RepID=A0A078B1F1_STYLE|nr:UNKNOWN [Stylonychia lemnae]|eukprot:CDW87172.1 UNKNOWN [Stylonychia lemnae]
MAVLAYFLILLSEVVQHEAVNIKYSQYYRNLLEDNVIYQLNQEQFDIGISFLYLGPDSQLQEELDTYFSVQISQVTSEQVTSDGKSSQYGQDILTWVNEKFELEQCQSGRLSNEDQTLDTGGMWCAKNFQMKLQGNIASKKRRLGVTEILYCQQYILDQIKPGKTCKSKNEINSILSMVVVTIVQKEQYFDTKEFSQNPIKLSLQAFPLELKENLSQVSYFKISRNELQLKDSWFSSQIQGVEQEYYKSKYQGTTVSSSGFTYYDRIQSIQYYMSEDVEIVERSTDTILEIFSQVGGLMCMITTLLSFVSGSIQEFLFKSSILKKSYEYNHIKYVQNVEKALSKKQKKKQSEQETGRDLTNNSLDVLNTNLENSNQFLNIKKVKLKSHIQQLQESMLCIKKILLSIQIKEQIV